MTDTPKNRGVSPTDSKTPPSRRSFLNLIWSALVLIVSLEIIWVVISFFRPPKQLSQKGALDTRILCGPVNNFKKASVTAFVRGRFYLCRLADGGFLALSRRCTHLGCTVPWDEEKQMFACPCHASTFDITGAVISSPAPRALDFFAVEIENDVVSVDTGRPFKRDGFSKEQVVYSNKESDKDA